VKGILVFDMDGVLVDVTDSYRETIIRTVEHFTGRRVTRDFIQEVKNRGGFNDDFQLSHTVSRELGVEVRYDDVVDHFQRIFLGENNDGLILQEKWLPQDGLLTGLARDWRLAIFTGRTRDEARLTLDRFARDLAFDPVIGNQEVENLKPAPDGLLRIRAECPDLPAIYLGDTVDDARSARAAGVPFIGVAAHHNTRREDLVRLFQAEGAQAVVENVNEVVGVLG
jgi:HAD superfamily phosphatase